MYREAAELIVASGLLVATTQSVKYRDCPDQRPWAWDDVALGGLFGLTLFAAAQIYLYGGLAAALLYVALFFGLWLDAVLYRIFTIELGFGGIGGIVFSLMFVELSQLSRARQFFADNLLFALLPAAAAVIALLALFGTHTAATIGLLIYFGLMYRGRVGKTRPRSFSLKYFFVPRPPPDTPNFVPRPEHAALLDRPRYFAAQSRLHGTLTGADVVLLSFESAGRDHVDPAWLERFAAPAIRSRNHFCPSPTTNNAHECLYEPESLAPLVRAGYRTIYLSAVNTQYFGLRPILGAAGFQTILDASALESQDDYVLLSRGLTLLEGSPQGQPLFLHVHATNTHVPYRVVDRARFSRHDHGDDRGRFTNGLEETAHIFCSFVDALRERGLVRDPLVIITSDHGQSFGELGFHSHGSAVTKEQVTVPFLMHHERFSPEEVSTSSHFDVVPTVLDLLGIENTSPAPGSSIFLPRVPQLLLWAGHPSRSTTTNYGMISGPEKFMVDLIRDQCYRMDWNDHDRRLLEGAEKEYYSVLLSKMMIARGIR